MRSLSMASPSFVAISLLVALLHVCSHVDGEHASQQRVKLVSLLPGRVCSRSKGSPFTDDTRLSVVHRHGPCSPLRRRAALSPEQILANDQSRVAALQRRISGASTKSDYPPVGSSEVPVHSGRALSVGDYVITVGFGTPKTDQTLIFDTGSDVTWIQCRPCVSYCHRQMDRLFDPVHSSTYANISCASAYCDELDVSGCSGSTCLYGVAYGDNSKTVGFYALDTLTLTPTDVIRNFRFGCGQDNEGLFGSVAGLLGLGRGNPSLISQTYAKYGGVFAYCLPSSPSSTGYLSFGGGGYSSPNVKFIPMLTDAAAPTFYYLNLIGISVAGENLPLPASVFQKAGTIIDSGTTISRLPQAAYSMLREAYRRAMAGYMTAARLSILDTCYDFTGHSEVVLPTVALQFDGGVSIDLNALGIVYIGSQSQVCLAFAANDDDGDAGILGNVQQKTFEVVYDVSKRLIGFGRGGC